MRVSTPESPLYLSFPKNRARSSGLSHKTVEGVWDLPSEPENGWEGKDGVVSCLPTRHAGDDIISLSSKVVQAILIHHS